MLNQTNTGLPAPARGRPGGTASVRERPSETTSPPEPSSAARLGHRVLDVGVVDDHEMFALGLRVSLSRDPRISLVTVPAHGDVPPLDLAVVSAGAASDRRFRCPLVVCGGGLPLGRQSATGNAVVAVLPRASLTPEQLLATVHAAAAGLRVSPGQGDSASSIRPDGRSLDVLRMLAEGACTQEIADRLGYSDRTIKGVIHLVERALGARSRAHAVARAIRQGWI